MSFTPKNLTQGGQMTAYRLRMFVQVNQWISHWMVLLFLVATGGLFWAVTPDDTLRNGFWYWSGRLFSSFLPLMDRSSPATWDISWHCEPAKLCTTKLTLAQLLASEWMQVQGAQLLQNLKLCAAGCGTVALALFCYIAWYVGRIGKKESEDEYISGMKLTDRLDDVNRQLKKAGEKSDLQIGGLHMVKNAEVMNFLIHGTIGVGKSTLIRWLLDYIRRRGDRAIIYDSGGTFIETHYDERRDKILNPHDSRCENWVLWRECPEVVDYENLTAALIPVEGDSDPFWVSSSRTIFSDAAMQFAAAPDRSIETFLKTLLSIDLKSLREFLKNTPSANLVEEKIEKTAISIRSVLTNYAKSLRYLQGLDRSGRPEFSVREWMTDAQYDNSWLFISTTARHRKAVRPLISMWLSLATLQLQSMGENSERRVWVIGDEIAGLQKIPELNETLAEGRKFGACFVLGIQNIPQLVNIYGREMAKAIFDLLNTRAYGRSPSAEVAKMVEDELGHQRRREAREQNSYGLDQIRDGISISKDKVNEPVVDYDQIMTMPNLRFYVRLPGEYPVVKLALKYRRQKKYHPALLERDFRDRLSPELESLIKNNESAARTAGLSFPTGDELLEGPPAAGADIPSPVLKSTPASAKKTVSVTPRAPVRPAPEAAEPVTVVPEVPPVLPLREAHHQPEPAPAPVTGSEKQADTPLPANVRAFTPRSRTDTPVPASPALSPAVTAPGTTPAEDQSETRAKASPAPVIPVPPAPVLPAMNAPLRGPSALDMLARKAARKPVTGSGEGDDDDAPVAEAQGEAPELQMAVETDERGELTLRTAGTRKASPESREEAYAEQYGRAGRLMADEEQNILRHRDDYEAYQDMSDHHEPGGYER